MSDIEERRLALHRRIADLSEAIAEAIAESGLTPAEAQLKVTADDFRTEAANLRRSGRQ